MLPVAVIAGAGWLFLFVVLLIAPVDGPGGDEGGDQGEAPPAVISLLIGRLEKLGLGATLIDLAARGWFQVRAPGGPPALGPGRGDGAWEPAGPAMCVVSAESPAGPLTPFERRVLAHVALRAGALGEVPAPALSDGFERGEDAFMKAFRQEVDAEARRRGLTRARLSGRRIGLLCLLAFVPAVALLIAAAGAHRNYPLAYAGVAYFVLCVVAIGTGTSRRRSAAGQAAVKKWRSAVAAPGEARLLAYAAALELAPAALAVFAPSKTNMAWSSYRGSWQQLEIETSDGPALRSCLILLAIAIAPIAYVGGAIWLGTHGEAGLAEDMVGLVVAGAIAGAVAQVARRKLARFAEFDGQVIRQWIVTGDSDTPDQYHVAVDDGTRAKAWDLVIDGELWRLLPPSTFVHVRVNVDHREQVTVHPVEPPAVARPLENAAAETALAGLLPLVDARLRDLAARGAGSGGQGPLGVRIAGLVRNY
jgi:hypothetical protein